MTLSAVRAMPCAEVEEWRDWLTYKAWEQKAL